MRTAWRRALRTASPRPPTHCAKTATTKETNRCAAARPPRHFGHGSRCKAASLVCLWELDRIALGTRARFPVACAQLAGNAVGRLVPGAPTPFAVDMLRRAGFDAGRATAALTASTGLPLGTTGGAAAAGAAGDRRWRAGQPRPCQRGLSRHRRAVVAAGSWYGRFAADRPLELSGRAIQRLLNATVRRDRHVAGLPQKLLADRDFIRTTLGGRWKGAVVAAAANTGFDYLALLCALRAVGAAPRPSLVLLAYTSAELLALVPFTPGGLGFVEAGLVGTLKLAGVPGTAGADRDAAVPAGRLLVADSRRRRRLPPVPPPLPLG